MSSALSMSEMRRGYDRLRKRYFLDAPPPLNVPPLAKDLIFEWLPENSDALAQTNFDEEYIPRRIRFRRRHNDVWTLARISLLHEMTHMRLGPLPSCGAFSHAWAGARIKRSSLWHMETVRLAKAGAFQL